MGMTPAGDIGVGNREKKSEEMIINCFYIILTH